MAGLFGAFHLDSTRVLEPALKRMQDFLAAIGPDEQRIFIDESGQIALGHTLYRINRHHAFDHQPSTLQNVTSIASARLDGREDLARALRSAGGAAGADLHDVEKIADSELVLRSYLAWGEDCPLHLQGEFSAAIWDADKRRLVMFCDPFACETLGYSFANHPQLGRVFAFANRTMALIHYPTVDLTLSEVAIADFLLLESVSAIERSQTVFQNVFALRAGSLLVCDNDGVRVRKYWSMPIDPMIRYRTEADYVAEYKHLLWQSVEDRLHADKTLISMSGGLDSPALTAVALDLVKQGRIHTSIHPVAAVYDRIHPDNDEAYYIGLVARKLNIPVDIRPQDDERFENLALLAYPALSYGRDRHEYTDRIFGGTRFVVVDGHGSDESFRETPLWQTLAAHPIPQALEMFFWLWRFTGRRPRFDVDRARLRQHLRNWMRLKTTVPFHRKFPLPEWINPEFAERLQLQDRWRVFLKSQTEVRRHVQPNAYEAFIENEYGGLIGTMYPPKRPPALSATPFIDIRLLRFMLALPPQLFNKKKRLLRLAMTGMLPEEVLTRRKHPLGLILHSLLRLPGNDWIDAWEPLPELAAYVCREAIPKITGEYAAPEITHSGNLHPLALNHWLTHFRELEHSVLQAHAEDLKTAQG